MGGRSERSGTHVDGPISTYEGEHGTHESDAERQPLRVPTPHVDEGGEDLLSVTLRAEDKKRDQNSKEAKDMQDQQRSFELGKKPPSSYIDEHTKQNDSPVE